LRYFLTAFLARRDLPNNTSEASKYVNIEDPLSSETDWQKHYIVCGKSVLEGQAYCHVRVDGKVVAFAVSYASRLLKKIRKGI